MQIDEKLTTKGVYNPPHVGWFVYQLFTDNMTITEAAARLKIGRPALSRVVNEKADLSVSLAARVEDVFRYSGEALLKYQAEYKFLKYRETVLSEILPFMRDLEVFND